MKGEPNIIQIGHPVDTVPTAGYGGIGRVVTALHHNLRPDVTVAVAGSYGERIHVAEGGSPHHLVAAARQHPTARTYLAHTPETADLASEAFGPEKVLEMLHMPVEDPRRYQSCGHHLIGISSAQLTDVWCFRPDAQVAWHGTPVVSPEAGDGGYAAWVGRFSPEKGPEDAILAARQAGIRLLLIGKATNGDEEEYLRRHITPLLGEGVEWLGEMDSEDRDRVVGEACALLVPTRLRESFGLVVIEAAMLGTPVLGYPAGATKELLETGIGTVCHGRDDMAKRLVETAAGALHDRARVHGIAKELFSVEAQAARVAHIIARTRTGSVS